MVTILIAVYNGEKYLKEQLDSIKKQTYDDWRIIARDDGSSDGSVRILKDFALAVENEVLIYVNSPASGSAKNNFAMLLNDAADSEYVMFSDQDDVWKEYKIEICMKEMKRLEGKHGSAMPLLVHGDLEVAGPGMDIISRSMFDFSGIRRSPSFAQLLVQNNVTGCTMLANKALCDGIACIAGREEIIMHDYLAALYAMVFGNTVFIDRPLLSYRQHGRNSVGAKAGKSPAYLMKRLMDGKKDYRMAMLASQKQAALFLETYGGAMSARGLQSMLWELSYYSSINKMNYFRRVSYYFARKAWKKGVARKIMQFLWG